MVQAVDVTNFITSSESSYHAFKTATLLKTLSVNALIMGEVGVGKRSLASFILPDASIVDASNANEVLNTLENCNEMIIINLDHSSNIKILLNAISKNSTRVIATSKESFNNELADSVFSIKFNIPSLSKRKEDVEPLIQQFVLEAQSIFGGESVLNTQKFQADLTQNALSLRRQVMINYLLQDIQDTELMQIMQNYLVEKLGSKNDYRKFLHLYEAPLIEAGLKKFKSQLQLSDVLGLNRNTLRKKIADNKQYLQGKK